MKHMLFLGLGYSARVLALRLASAGWRITGTARTPEGAAAIAGRGWNAVVFDGARPSAAFAAALADATHVVVSVPPSPDGDPCLVHHAADLAAAARLRWIGYFSTVGVYGDADGGWVDESTPCHPASERGRRRQEAEKMWHELGAASGKRVTVFRLPGIYGPGRSVFDALRAGAARRIIKPGQVFNRIHVDDIAGAVIAALESSDPGPVYNVTDDLPGPPEDVVTYAASLLGMSPPPAQSFETADLSPMARSFYGESKRVSNSRIKTELGFALIYPTYREGLAAILAQTESGASRSP